MNRCRKYRSSSGNVVNIAFMRLFREGKGDIAYTIVESDGRLPEAVAGELRENENVHEVMIVQP